MPIVIAATPPVVTGSGTITTAAFSPPADSLLVVVLMASVSTVVISNTGTARTWTLRKQHATSAGVRIYTALNPTALTNITVSASGASYGLKVYVITGHHATAYIGATGEGSSTTNAVTVNAYTSTGPGRGIFGAIDFSALGAPTSTDDESAWDVAGTTSGMAAVKSADTSGSGTTVTLNLDAAGTGAPSWRWVALEILSSSLDATVDATTVDATADIPTPTVTTTHNETVTPAVVTATAAIPTPTVAASDSTVTTTVVTASASIDTPTVTAVRHDTASPAVVDATAEIATPTVVLPVLPGQYVTGNFQIEWASQLYGGYGNVYQVIAGSVEGWDDLPGMDSDSALRPSRHGAWPGRSLGQQREVSAIIAVDDPTTFIASMRALRRATSIAEDDAEYALVISTYGEALLAYGSISARSIPVEHYGQGWAQVSLRWICSDPRRFDLVQQSVVIAANGSQTLINEGDTATSPRFRILGPAVNPVLINETSDRVLGFDATLADGQLLEIDTQLGTVKIGDVSYMSTLSSESVPVEDFVLGSGDNFVTYETGSGGTAGAETIWRSAFI